jgi:flagellar hook-associated protein 3 FlgL
MRISTTGSYATMTANLLRAQARQALVGEQIQTERYATDLKGYSKNAEVLTAMLSSKAKIDGLVSQTTLVNNRLDTQNNGITQVMDSAQGARTAIANAVAANSGANMMVQLEGFFGQAIQGLNTKSQDGYVFSGAQSNVPPTSATTMASLSAAPSTASLFHNDQYMMSNRVDQSTSVDTGFLGDKLGTDLFDAFKQVQDFANANPGPPAAFSGALTTPELTFLTSMLKTFDDAHTGLISAGAQNGMIQQRFETAQDTLSKQSDTLKGMVGGITDVNLAEAATRLEAAKVAVQASAQVFTALQGSSLLNVLQ